MGAYNSRTSYIGVKVVMSACGVANLAMIATLAFFLLKRTTDNKYTRRSFFCLAIALTIMELTCGFSFFFASDEEVRENVAIWCGFQAILVDTPYYLVNLSILAVLFGWVKSYLFLDAVLTNKADTLPNIEKNLDKIYFSSMAYVLVILTFYDTIYVINYGGFPDEFPP